MSLPSRRPQCLAANSKSIYVANVLCRERDPNDVSVIDKQSFKVVSIVAVGKAL